MNTIQTNQETLYEDIEEIYLERARYLLNVDDMLEQIILEEELENNNRPVIPTFQEDNIMDIYSPLTFAFNF